jgi:hypothetical protein
MTHHCSTDRVLGTPKNRVLGTPKNEAPAGICISCIRKFPWGEPDLQGIWANRTVTPLERPKAFAGKEVLTDTEVAQVEKRSFENTDRDRRGGRAETDVARAYNDFWNERGTPPKATNRTSLIVDPPDGRIPPYTAEALKKFADWATAHGKVGAAATLVGRTLVAGGTSEEGVVDGLEGGGDGRGVRSDNPEDRNLGERCITFGLPRLPGGYNNNLQIVQSPGYVSILAEMGWETRVIALDGRPHLPRDVRQWLGDSRGHWEGKTLVVDTTNFSDKASFRGSFETLHLIERFTRIEGRHIGDALTQHGRLPFAMARLANAPGDESRLLQSASRQFPV